MNRKRVLVCGGTGFIGRNLVEHLSKRRDLEVHATHFKRPAFNCPEVVWHRADLRQQAEVEALFQNQDVVIQAAATTSGIKDITTQPYIHVTDNAVMNSLMLRAAFDQHVGRFIFFSCTVMHKSSESPLTEIDWDANEEMEFKYFGSGWTKVYCEKMCEFFSRLGRTRHTVIRHSNIYGPHDKYDLEKSHVFGATLAKVLTAKGPSVTVWGSGEEARDLLYVGDLVRFVELAMDKQSASYDLFNIGYGKAVSIKQLVQDVVSASGKALSIEYDLSKPTVKVSLTLDCDKAKQHFGWEPQVSLKDGIARTIAWWRTANQGKDNR